MTPRVENQGSSPIESIQPGGGYFFELEKSWHRCRRFFLRLFFPGHVKKMAGLRFGECPGCPHDIIDSRDLKHYSNVCGFSFPPATDPYAWRKNLWFARPGIMELLCFSAVMLPLAALTAALGQFHHPGWWAPSAVVCVFWLFIVSFFRNPPRKIPSDPSLAVSPADGVVSHLEEVDEPGMGKMFRVSVFLSVFNVHVNRSPVAGVVRQALYFPGEFLDARDQQCSRRNEQLWLDLETAEGYTVRVKQIAGAIARRIVCQVGPGHPLQRGELYGMIKFGSRTDFLIPLERVGEVRVRVGSKVSGGSTILMKLKD
ncbi:MAG: phosphatidylserine decarboxylase family protein [Gemmataceae bacterium]|nr:phosphatidylserine decarboxylase family protein [Gemmataceae bacterium]